MVPSVIDAGITLTDADSPALVGATVTISGGFFTGDVLGFVNQNGIAGVYNAGTHVLTLSGSASVANYQTALRSVTFSSTSDDPTSGGTRISRAVSWVANDGSQNSLTTTSTVNVTAVNDAPQNTVPSAFSTPAGHDFSIVGLSVSDVDATTLTTTLHVDHGTLVVA